MFRCPPDMHDNRVRIVFGNDARHPVIVCEAAYVIYNVGPCPEGLICNRCLIGIDGDRDI